MIWDLLEVGKISKRSKIKFGYCLKIILKLSILICWRISESLKSKDHDDFLLSVFELSGHAFIPQPKVFTVFLKVHNKSIFRSVSLHHSNLNCNGRRIIVLDFYFLEAHGIEVELISHRPMHKGISFSVESV